jgi:tubulin-folding cofactor B
LTPFASPVGGWTIHVTDLDPNSLAANGGLDDGQVEKYTLSGDAAAARAADLKKSKQSMKKAPVGPEHMAELAAELAVGAAGEINGTKRGVIRYVGKIGEIAPGWWVGVEYDEACGKNDGAVKGVRYFECPENTGGLVRPDKVQPGDE